MEPKHEELTIKGAASTLGTENLTESRELKYVDEFKELIAHGEYVAAFLRIENEVKEKTKRGELSYGDIFIDGDLKVTIIDLKGESNNYPATDLLRIYFKAEIGDQTFFVKNKPGFYKQGIATSEINDIIKAKQCLVGLPYAEVVEYQLGYKDNDNRTYFVSKWTDAPLLGRYFRRKFGREIGVKREGLYEEPNEERDTMEAKFQAIKDALEGFVDVESHNMLYDPKSEKFIIFDVHLL